MAHIIGDYDPTETMLLRKFGVLPAIDDELPQDAEADDEEWALQQMERRIEADWEARASVARAEADYLTGRM